MLKLAFASRAQRSERFRKFLRLWLWKSLALLCGAAIAGGALLFPQGANAVTSTVKTFPLPAAPFDVKVGGGKIWFTLPDANKIGSLEILASGPIEQYLYTFYSPPTPNSEPYRLAVDSDNVWFTQRRGNRIGRLSIADGVITEYEVPTPASEPSGIDVALDGRVWFVQSKTDKVAFLTPSSGVIQEIDVGYANAGLDRIDATSTSVIWMTAPGVEMLLGYRPAFNDIVPISIVDHRPGAGAGAVRGLAATSSGVPWISTKELPKLAVYMYGTLATWIWQSYPLESADLVDILLMVESSQTFLWALDGANREVVQIDSSNMQLIHRVGVGASNSVLTSLALEPVNKIVWVADAGASALHAIAPPYALKTYLPVVAR
jgi:streptogramin lyase